MKISKRILNLAGVLSFAVALFQAVVTFSIPWSRYFGAPKELLSNPPLLYASGLLVALIFFVFGLYALSGAGTICRLPLLRTGLVTIGAVYTLRGLSLVTELPASAGCHGTSIIVPWQELASSSVALVIGLLYSLGAAGCWSDLSSRKRREIKSPGGNPRTINAGVAHDG